MRGLNPENFIYNRPINRRAALGAKEIWFLSVDGTDAILEEVNRLIVKGRPRVFLGAALDHEVERMLADIADAPSVVPSAGAKILFHVLRAYPDHEVTLFGFTHEGWPGHTWDAEAAWIDGLVKEGKVRKAPLEPPFAKDPIIELLRREPVRASRFFRRLMHPKS